MCPVERQEGFKSKATERVGRKGTASMCVTKNKTWQHQFNCFFFFLLLSHYNQNLHYVTSGQICDVQMWVLVTVLHLVSI